jgi:RHS repeat-associated protein
LTWDARDRLNSLAGPGVTGSFAYDAEGRRTLATVNATATGFLYSGLTPVQELSGTTPTANLLTGLGIDEYLARDTGTGARSYLPDALGSTVALTTPAGAVETSYTYEPFGTETTTGAPATNRFGFTGREDDGTGLLYYRARYYSPTLQRFVSEDPAGFVDGPNLYGYVANSPANYSDPFGLDKDRDCGPVPDFPPDADIEANIRRAREMGEIARRMIKDGRDIRWLLFWFANMVKPGGPWDYKTQGPPGVYIPFGNFNYGATGSAAGFSDDMLRRSAGLAQFLAGNWDRNLGIPFFGGPPHGDGVDDQAWIIAGIEYFKCMAGL